MQNMIFRLVQNKDMRSYQISIALALTRNIQQQSWVALIAILFHHNQECSAQKIHIHFVVAVHSALTTPPYNTSMQDKVDSLKQ